MKKFITSVLSALATAVCSTAIVSNAAFNPNKDPNGDGVLGIADAVYISQYLCGLFEPTDLSQLDVDDNDIVSIVDQIYMQMYEAGSITSRFGENESPDTITRTQTSRQYNVYNAVTTLYLRNYTLKIRILPVMRILKMMLRQFMCLISEQGSRIKQMAIKTYQ